jgi:para-aminobenzoate synthetase component 1
VDYVTPEVVFNYLSKLTNLVFLDSSMPHQYYGRYSILLLNPLELFDDLNLVSQKYSQLLNTHTITKTEQLPFTGGFAGYLNYELGYQFEPALNQQQNTSNMCLALYNQAIIFDVINQEAFITVAKIASYNCDYSQQLEDLYQLYQQSITANLVEEIQNISLPKLKFNLTHSQASYTTMVNQAKQHILNGDIFQVNLAQAFTANIPPNYPTNYLYHKLRTINPAPFSAFVKLNGLTILSASPERFIAVKNKIIETRPIKGTINRDDNPDNDNYYAHLLQNSAKDRAENIMIVDLMRNDLSKICHSNSVEVSQLCQIESFTNLHHLVSVVNGKLRDEITLFDIIKAVFPGGSITGAPKIRAMQIIEELEAKPRGIYCGSIGYFSLNGNIDLSIAIRTMVIQNNQIIFQAGGGITLDSDPLAEYHESMLKAQKIREIFQ